MEKLEKVIPALSWIKNYKSRYFYFDLIAGINLAVSMLPKAMAYALVAGLPPIYGLYASFVAPLVAIIFGSNKLLFTGPVGVMTVLVYTSISKYAEPGTPEYINLAAVLALIVGVVIFLIAVFRLTFILNLISHAAVIGFVNAAALIIIATQLKYIFGIHIPHEEFVINIFIDIAKSLGEANLYVFVLSLLAFTMIILIKKHFHKLPETLLALVLLTLITYFFNLEKKGVELVGTLPTGIPSPTLPLVHDISVIPGLIVAAVVISIVGMTETYSISKIVAYNTKQKVDFNQEFLGQGLANIVVSFFKGYPVCGSFSGTSVNWSSGARTGFSIIIFSIFALLSITVLTPIFYYLPKFMLAVIVILAVVKLFKPSQLIELYKINKYDGAVALLTFLVSIITKPDYGIVVGIVTALGLYVWRTMHTRVLIVVKEAEYFVPKNPSDNLKLCPQIIILKPEGPIMYVNAEHIRDEILRITKELPHLKHVIVDMVAVYYFDASGVDAFRDLIEELEKRNIELSLIHVSDDVKLILKKSNIAKKIKIFEKKKDAIIYSLKDVDIEKCKKCEHTIFKECKRLKEGLP